MSILLMAAAVVAAGATMPLPGTVNYLEGQVTLNGEPLPESAAGQAAVQTNQVLDTAQGMVELLLTPGVVLRVGSSSELRMVAPDAPNIAFELVKGGAILEVDQSFKGVTFSVLMDGATVDIAKPGLYFLGADQPGIGVLAGEAAVYQGSAHLTLKRSWRISARRATAEIAEPGYVCHGKRAAVRVEQYAERVPGASQYPGGPSHLGWRRLV
jgi:hypothetical protein